MALDVRLARAAVLVLFLAGCATQSVSTSSIPLTGPSEVADCQPCTILVGTTPDGWQVVFERADDPVGGAVVSSIQVRRPGDCSVQTLAVADMEPALVAGTFRFGGEDLDGDGYADLLLVTARGVVNTYAEYWRFDPSTARFIELGTFPLLQRDKATGHLVAYERQGGGGLFFSRTEYDFNGGVFEIVRLDEQEQLDDGSLDRIRHVVKERRSGELVTVTDEVVPAR